MTSAATREWEREGGMRTIPAALCRRALSALHVGLVLLVGGTPTWANPAAIRLLGSEDDLDGPWWAAVARMALQLERPATPCTVREMRTLGVVRTPGGRLRVCAVHLPAARGVGGDGDDVVLVAVERSGRAERPERRPDDAKLRRRFHLTTQELHVARFLADGLSNAQLAAALGISPNTARVHTERVLRKLGVHSRAAVASTLLRG